MKNILFLCSLVLGVLCLGMSTSAANPVKVDVLFMNHGPLMGTLNKMKTIFSGYGNQLNISWHDFETEEGEQFMAKMGIKQHVPLVIWIDGKPKWTVGVKEITFAGFPSGSGPAFFQGKWTLDDLKGALNLATGKK
ncbi:MAG: hypothetical protein WA974_00690 [Thermodesulfobacteriota bacterium]